MISIRQILKSVYDAVDGICERTFIQDRPKSVKQSLSDYIVVRCPSSIVNKEIDQSGSFDYFDTTIQIEVYVKDKGSANNPNQININSMDNKVSSVMQLFPIKDEHVNVMRPVITLSIADGNGFHCTIIQAKLTTLV